MSNAKLESEKEDVIADRASDKPAMVNDDDDDDNDKVEVPNEEIEKVSNREVEKRRVRGRGASKRSRAPPNVDARADYGTGEAGVSYVVFRAIAAYVVLFFCLIGYYAVGIVFAAVFVGLCVPGTSGENVLRKAAAGACFFSMLLCARFARGVSTTCEKRETDRCFPGSIFSRERNDDRTGGAETKGKEEGKPERDDDGNDSCVISFAERSGERCSEVVFRVKTRTAAMCGRFSERFGRSSESRNDEGSCKVV
jgi:hypothetical protein